MQQWPDRRAEHQQRRRDDGEKHVLDHVDRERGGCVAVDRGRQRGCNPSSALAELGMLIDQVSGLRRGAP